MPKWPNASLHYRYNYSWYVFAVCSGIRKSTYYKEKNVRNINRRQHPTSKSYIKLPYSECMYPLHIFTIVHMYAYLLKCTQGEMDECMECVVLHYVMFE